MLRFFAVMLSLSCFVGCGADPSFEPEVAEEEAPLQPVVTEPGPSAPQLAVRAPNRPVSLRGLQAGPTATVQVHSLAVPDGTRVEFMLGLVGCGMMVVAQDTAVVHGGAFEIAYDPENVGHFGDVSLFFRVVPEDGAACDEGTQVKMVHGVTLPGAADLSTAEPTYAGCWLFRPL